MSAPIEDVTSLPGKKVSDQDGSTLGEIKDIYAVDGDGQATWVTIEASFGMGDKRTKFIPLARIKDEDGELLVPYSKGHIENTPDVDASDGISAECERQLRDHFGIDRADQEVRTDNNSYATLVPNQSDVTSKKVEDVDSLETPDADTRTDETRERLEDPGSSEIRHVSAQDVTGHGDEGGSGEESGSDSSESDRQESDSSGSDRQESDSSESDRQQSDSSGSERQESDSAEAESHSHEESEKT